MALEVSIVWEFTYKFCLSVSPRPPADGLAVLSSGGAVEEVGRRGRVPLRGRERGGTGQVKERHAHRRRCVRGNNSKKKQEGLKAEISRFAQS